ncbi:MAG: SirA family protein [Chloroflexi bacterium]|nr:SirA family protein [Chloroflexota bacterium]
MSIKVDARGFSCPQPVMMAQKAIQEGKFPIEVLVDSSTARENVRRLAEMKGCKTEITSQDDEFTVKLIK